MAKALWFLIKPALVMMGWLTAVYAVLALFCTLTAGNTFFFTYVQGFFLVFDIILGICAAQAISGYAPLALSFGVTRRALRGAVAAFWVLLPLVCMVLDYLCNSVTARLFAEQANLLFIQLVHYPLHGLGFKLLLCGAMLWMGTLEFSALHLAKRIAVILLMIVIYLQITVLMFVATLIPTTILTVYSIVLGVAGILFAGIALHRVGRLVITQV